MEPSKRSCEISESMASPVRNSKCAGDCSLFFGLVAVEGRGKHVMNSGDRIFNIIYLECYY